MVRRRSTVRFREGAPESRVTWSPGPDRGGVAQGQSRRLIIAESVVRVHPPLRRNRIPWAGTFSTALNHLRPPAEDKRMTLRYCPHCAAEVATVDGFCRLGHSVKLLAPVASLSVFSDESGNPAEDTRAGGTGPPPPPERLGMAPLGRFGALWEKGDLDRAGTDPIAQFAPYPRMDWGPRWPWRRSLSRRRRD